MITPCAKLLVLPRVLQQTDGIPATDASEMACEMQGEM